MLKTRSDATNRFFEARVAVMGFKCRTMQLQGELEELVRSLLSKSCHTGFAGPRGVPKVEGSLSIFIDNL